MIRACKSKGVARVDHLGSVKTTYASMSSLQVPPFAGEIDSLDWKLECDNISYLWRFCKVLSAAET